MNRCGTLAIILVAAALCPVAAQDPPATRTATALEVHIERIDIGRFPLLNTFLQVMDPDGRAVAMFERRSFQLSEQGQRCRMENFKIDLTPLSVALLIDSSGSMFPSMLDLKRACAHFIRVLEPYDQALLMSFSDMPRLLVPFTLDQERLVMALGPVEAFGPTALHDAIHKGVLELVPMPGRRIMVLLTDGQDQNAAGTARQSRHTLQEALDLAVKNQIIIYVVALGRWINKTEVQRIAEATRGEVYFTHSSQELERIYMLISRNLKSRIEVSYRTPNPRVDGSWRTFEVKVAAAGGYGADQATYRAPGRYVVELPGQEFDRLRLDQLKQEIPQLRLRDLNMKEVLLGGKKELSDWVESYFKR
ncbi:MAG: VWA domain-containing protein [Candidatus Riflebacteria bacterium]|nr:VWA domain-containing protein [Candidatus Riflebacteria bacterium]